MRQRESNLLVIEYGGTARSGKGTIVNHLTETRENVTSDETGADYRALTKALLLDNIIERGMSGETLTQKLARVSLSSLADRVAQRHAIVNEFGLPSLYENDVNETVSLVAPIDTVRKAVKAGFQARVEAVRDANEHEILVVDGRNLGPVIDSIHGTNLLMRTFVSCSAFEAGWRECARQGIDLKSPEGEAIVRSICQRNENDANRQNDPVKPDGDAIDYWYNGNVLAETVRHFADTLYDSDFNKALEELFVAQQEIHSSILRLGAGALAANTRRQIYFDTGQFRSAHDNPKHAMLEAADIMFEEALKTTKVSA